MYVRSLGLKSVGEWHRFCAGKLPAVGERPSNIPANPHSFYEEWVDYRDWLPFDEARRYSRALGLNSIAEWKRFVKGQLREVGQLPSNIPHRPDVIKAYADHWKDWDDWLGTEIVANYNKKYMSFKKARAFARQLQLRSNREWRKYCNGDLPDKGKRSENMPRNPDTHFKKTGWVNWGDWLGTDNVSNWNRKYRAFAEAKKFVHSLGLKTQNDWHAYCGGDFQNIPKRPIHIPSAPDRQKEYEDNWISWPDWLGTSKGKNK